MTESPAVRSTAGGVDFDVKVVPGGSRDQIVGLLGGSLKVKVAAPPEGGKANKAVCALLAAALGVPKKNVSVAAGQTQPRKRIVARGVDERAARAALAPFLQKSRPSGR